MDEDRDLSSYIEIDPVAQRIAYALFVICL